MTAGSGIVHSERTDPSWRSSGGLMHGMQAWVALPREDEEVDAAFAHHAVDALPEMSDGGIWARLIAGSAYGLSNAVRTYSPLFYLHAELAAGASIAMPTDHAERAAYVVSGTVVHEGVRHEAGRMLVFAAGGEPVIAAEDAAARVMLLGGANIGPRFIWWNLVSSRSERIEQAKADWQAGRMALPPDDNREFIPLPDDPPPSPGAAYPV
jgi:redox-sensitive bicupin YhaK (pirin superfamily)